MNEQQNLRQKIINHCLSNDNILDILRNNSFDREKFDELYKMFEEYSHTLKHQKSVDRTIAGYLNTFQTVLQSRLLYEGYNNKNSNLHLQLQNADNHMIELIDKFFWVE